LAETAADMNSMSVVTRRSRRLSGGDHGWNHLAAFLRLVGSSGGHRRAAALM